MSKTGDHQTRTLGWSSTPRTEELCFLKSGKQGSVCPLQQEKRGRVASTSACQLLSPSGCMYHCVETSIPDDSVLGPGGVSQADSVAGSMTPCHPLPCCFDGGVILFSPLVQPCSLKTLQGASAFVDTGARWRRTPVLWSTVGNKHQTDKMAGIVSDSRESGRAPGGGVRSKKRQKS